MLDDDGCDLNQSVFIYVILIILLIVGYICALVITQKKQQTEVAAYLEMKNSQKFRKRGIRWATKINLYQQYLHIKFLQQPFSQHKQILCNELESYRQEPR